MAFAFAGPTPFNSVRASASAVLILMAPIRTGTTLDTAGLAGASGAALTSAPTPNITTAHNTGAAKTRERKLREGLLRFSMSSLHDRLLILLHAVTPRRRAYFKR